MRFKALPPLSAADVLRFWSHVDRSGECWLWTGPRRANGYGLFSVGGRSYAAHRLALVLAGHSLNGGRIGMHACDTPQCVRVGPGHVRPATQSENMFDRAAKGRHWRGKPGGRLKAAPPPPPQELMEDVNRQIERLATKEGITVEVWKQRFRRSLEAAGFPQDRLATMQLTRERVT